jgi:hypothetical protein
MSERRTELVSRYIDGTLSAPEREELADALAADPERADELIDELEIHRELLFAASWAHEEEGGAARRILFYLRANAEGSGFARKVRERALRLETQERTTARAGDERTRPPSSALIRTAARRRRTSSRRRRRTSPAAAWTKYVLAPLAAAAAVLIGAHYYNVRTIARAQEAVIVEVGGQVRLIQGGQTRPARRGDLLKPGGKLEIAPGGSAKLEYRDEGGGRLDVSGEGGAELGFLEDDRAKRLHLEKGRLRMDVGKQPAGAPLVAHTPNAEARVVGTRFTLAVEADGASSLLDVEEGLVRLTRKSDRESVEVAAGFRAEVREGVELAAVPTAPAPVPVPVPEPAPPHDVYRQVGLDLGKHTTSGDAQWSVEGPVVRQTKISRARGSDKPSPSSSIRFPADLEGDVRVRATVRVDGVTPDRMPGIGSWGFGVLIRAGNRTVTLRSLQNAESQPVKGSVVEIKDLKYVRLEHEREGTYRLELLVERGPAGRARLRGRFWREGEPEPQDWTIAAEADMRGPITEVGLHTCRCACTFTGLVVEEAAGGGQR